MASGCLRRDRGAVVPEFILVAIVFFGFLFVVIEVARVLAVRSALVKGAQDAVILASKIPYIDADPDDFDCPSGTPTTAFTNYQSARRRVLNEATSFGSSIFVRPSTSPGLSTFRNFSVNDPCGTPESVDAVLLRPSAVSENYVDSRDLTTLNYPDFGSPVTPGEYGNVLRRNPICVEVQADVQLIVGLAGNYTMRGRACSYREPKYDEASPGSLPTLPTPTPTPTPSPSDSPTPRPTESPVPSESPRPTLSPTPSTPPTESPSPTNSPRPTNSPLPTQSPVPTRSPLPTRSPTPTPRPTNSPAPTQSPLPTASPTMSPSPTPSTSPAPTPTPSRSPTSSPSPTPFVCPSGQVTEERCYEIYGGLGTFIETVPGCGICKAPGS